MSNISFYEPFYDFDRLIEQAFTPRSSRNSNNQVQQQNSVDGAVRSFKPRMDIHEDRERNLVTATFEFPGVSKENVNIDVHNGRLTVSAETKQSSDFEEGGFAVRERHFGKFSRTLQLPQDIKEEEIKATMDSGILTVTFPKTTPELAPKRITIS